MARTVNRSRSRGRSKSRAPPVKRLAPNNKRMEYYGVPQQLPMATPGKKHAPVGASGEQAKVKKRGHGGGRYAGRFKKAKKVRISKKFDKYGIVSNYETGSVKECQARDVAYLGHSLDGYRVAETVCRALIRKLFATAGVIFSDWHQKLASCVFASSYGGADMVMRISVQFRRTQSDDASVETVQFDTILLLAGVPQASTWLDTANGLQLTLNTINPNYSQIGQMSLQTLSLVFIEPTDVSLVPSAVMDLNTEMIELEMYSSLMLQNRTKDVDGSSNTDNITVNPLKGKIYRSDKKWLNGFEQKPRRQEDIGSPGNQLFPYINNGIILDDSELNDMLKKPPMPWQFGVTKASGVLLQPGEIKRSKIGFKCSMYLNTLFNKIFQHIYINTGIPNPSRIELGFAELVALELLLDSRFGEGTGVNIQVGWELNQTFKAMCKTRRGRTAAVNTVSTVAF